MFRILTLTIFVAILSTAIPQFSKCDWPHIFFHRPVDALDDAMADVLIIGGSHAGLSAALTLARHQIDSLILDSNMPRNRRKTRTHSLPTWENRNPGDVRGASRHELI